jgi:hypothetical protein
MAASPDHIFAMKALAARTRDIDDLRLLADIVGVESADAASCGYARISIQVNPYLRGPQRFFGSFSTDYPALGAGPR